MSKNNKNLSVFSKNKKGNGIGDTLVVFLILFILGITGLVMYLAVDSIHQADLFTDPVAQESMDNLHERQPSTFDGMFITILVMFWIGSAILSYFIDSHPAFFVFSFVLLIILIIVGAVMGNAFQEFNEDLGFEDKFPMMTFFYDHLVLFIVGMVTTILIALFAKLGVES
jgi:hypothetical protein